MQDGGWEQWAERAMPQLPSIPSLTHPTVSSDHTGAMLRNPANLEE